MREERYGGGGVQLLECLADIPSSDSQFFAPHVFPYRCHWEVSWKEASVSRFNPTSNLRLLFFRIHSWDAAHSKHTAGSVCFAKWFLSAGWKASGTDLKSEAISYLIGWHVELSVDFSYRGEQGDNGKCVSNFLGCRALRKLWRDENVRSIINYVCLKLKHFFKKNHLLFCKPCLQWLPPFSLI